MFNKFAIFCSQAWLLGDVMDGPNKFLLTHQNLQIFLQMILQCLQLRILHLYGNTIH